MDLIEQNKMSEEIERMLFEKLKGKTFRASIAITDDAGSGFVFTAGNLSEKSSLSAWRTIVTGLTEEIDQLTEVFNTPVNTKFKKPIEFK
ncbi:MAG: hypothetical protein Q8R15_03565 [Candidatus Micrarchaeota archaeon]|nr:hypothetical protein [Candidatus Micrarchaeota archaeon]